MNIYRSEPFKNNHYTVELQEDSLFDWHVKLLPAAIDPESPLHADMKEWFRREGKDGIVLHIRFNDRYPLEPPMVRVVEPIISSEEIEIFFLEY